MENSEILENKNHPVIAVPDQIVTCIPSIQNWDFLVLVYDRISSIVLLINSDAGLWDVLRNQQVADFVIQRLGKPTMEPEDI